MQNDIDAENLTKAIRQKESGGDFGTVGDAGTSHGAYQFQPATWKQYSKDILGDENAPMTPQNQNAVAYGKIKTWKDQGKNAAEIAAMWNAGENIGDKWQTNKGKTTINGKTISYDTPQYVKDVTDIYQKMKGQLAPKTQETNQKEQPQENKAWFPSSPNDSGTTAGLKALGNTPQSAYNFGKGLVSSVNPVNILKNIGEIGNQFGQLAQESGGVGNALAQTVGGLPQATAETLVPKGVRQLAAGDISGASKSFTEDPFGQTAPIVLAAEGGAKLADNLSSKSAMKSYVENIGENTKNRVPIPKPTTTYSDAFGKTVETVAKPVTKGLATVGGKMGDFVSKVGGSVASHITGLDPETLRQVLSNPESFTKLQQDNISRGGLSGEVHDAIDTRLKDLSEVGKGYESVKSSNQSAPVEKGWIDNVLENKGLKIKKGKIIADSNSVTRNSSDINAVQKFYNDWSGKKVLTPNEFLNMRSDLAELSKFDKLTGMGKTRASESIGKSLYEKANSSIRNKSFEELKALDDTYSPEREFLQQVKKDYFNADGTFKDNAPSRIANAGNKTELLKRLENVVPGITKRIQILKAVEDIQRASGVKVGTYGRALTGGVGFATGGIPGFIISEILTSPEMAVSILRKAGYIGAKSAPIINTLRIIVGDVPQKGKGLVQIGSMNQGDEKSPYTGLLPLNRTQTNKQQ